MEVQALKRCLHFLCAVLERNIMGVAKRKQIIVPEECRKIPEECRKAHVTISVAASQSQARGHVLFRGMPLIKPRPQSCFFVCKILETRNFGKVFLGFGMATAGKNCNMCRFTFYIPKTGLQGLCPFCCNWKP